MQRELDTVARFVNTVHHEQGQAEEELSSAQALSDFLGVEAKPADLRRALEVREALRSLMAANNGEPLDVGAIERLNTAAARARLQPAFTREGWTIEPGAEGVDAALGGMLATVFSAMSDGSWSRMKACGNPDCRWAFHDASKNHSARWCEMASCGNRMKARAFRSRARKRAAQ